MTDQDQDLRIVSRGLGAVAQHARDLSRAPVSERMERLGRERLVLTALHARPRVKLELRARVYELVRVRWLAGAGAMLAVALLGLGSWALLHGGLRRPEQLAALSGGEKKHAPAEAPLTYRSYGGQPSATNYLVAPDAHADLHEDASGLRFSDGSEIVASPGARLRVDSTQSRGARVFLEQGRMRTHIEHREHGEHSNWVFVAGPFDVHVTGTTFNLAWDAGSQTVDLDLIEGSVSVTSPLGPSQIEVKTGQRFHASMLEGTMQLESADPTHASNAAGGPALRPLAGPSNQGRSIRSHRGRHADHGRASPARSDAPLTAAETRESEPREAQEQDQEDAAAGSFSDLMRAGAFARVIELATAAGLGKTLERGSADDVRALADAARYQHRTELAVRGLTVLRTRFPGTHHGTAAAFLLGRTYETAAQQSEARRFYELYLRETPSGEFAAEALAGRMRMVAALDGQAAAQTIADEYLRRFPRGVHAATARQLAR
jgi:hypothetical protein